MSSEENVHPIAAEETSPSPASTTLSADLLSILVCPLTRSPLNQEGEYLVAEIGGLKYPIRDGLPVLLLDEAELPEGIESLAAFKESYKAEIPDADQV